jgi:hypothetical protein
VKKERYDYKDDILEIEELIKHGVKKTQNNSDHGENGDKKEEPLIDLGNRNTQIVISVICIFIACIIFGYIGYKRYREDN